MRRKQCSCTRATQCIEVIFEELCKGRNKIEVNQELAFSFRAKQLARMHGIKPSRIAKIAGVSKKIST